MTYVMFSIRDEAEVVGMGSGLFGNVLSTIDYFQEQHMSILRQEEMCLFNKDLSNGHLPQSGLGIKNLILLISTEMYSKRRLEF